MDLGMVPRYLGRYLTGPGTRVFGMHTRVAVRWIKIRQGIKVTCTQGTGYRRSREEGLLGKGPLPDKGPRYP
eukprot:1094848-Rhodomonas_salina.1